MVNNIHNQYWIQWFALMAGRTLNHYVSEDRMLWDQRFRELYFNHLPFEDLERLGEISAPAFEEWLHDPSLDEYWRHMALSQDQYRRLHIRFWHYEFLLWEGGVLFSSSPQWHWPVFRMRIGLYSRVGS